MQLARTLRTIGASIAGIVVGLAHWATGRGAGPQPVLRPGDVAPDFTLAGSDGRVYRLRDLIGAGPIVLAWFPKAFTGG